MIKILETKDDALLAKLNEEVQRFHHEIQPNIFKPYNEAAIRDFFKTILNNENTIAYIAKENETVLGYVLLLKVNLVDNPFQYSRSFVLIDQILVLKNHQGKGVGKLLLEAVFAFAKTQNISLVELNHWTKNETARHFFNKNKFVYYNEKMWREV